MFPARTEDIVSRRGMMKASERLDQIKAEMEESTTIDKFVSLTNPKNVSLMESLVAWTCCEVKFDGDAEVSDDASMDDLWLLSTVNSRDFADTAGITVTDGITAMRRMKNLKMIFPDGTCLSKALAIVKMYVKGKIEDL